MLNTQKIFKGVQADAIVTEQSDLRFYLTGFESSFGVVITTSNGSTFYTDSRYIEAAKTNVYEGISVELYPKGARLSSLLEGYKVIAMPLDRISANTYRTLIEEGFTIVDSMPAFKSAMAVKSQNEIENIKKACEIADKSLLQLLPLLEEGMTENQAAAKLEYLMRINGASGTSFDTIMAFGENSSVPHHATSNRALKLGDIILIDFGCKYNGYCSDCTRTFLFGDDGKHENFKEAYSHVLKAHMLAKDGICAGMTGKQADALARDYLKEYGLDKLFTHSLGHGIGINIHEFPGLSPVSEDVLEEGMVFSDEPGVYFEGQFGIRIEDTMLLQNGKAVSLMKTDKNLLIIK